jgi:hypothetical protein
MTCSTMCFIILPSCFVSQSNIHPGPIHGGAGHGTSCTHTRLVKEKADVCPVLNTFEF